MPLINVGIVGCGFIGSELCRAVSTGKVPAEIVALNDIESGRAEKLKAEFGLKASVVSFEELVALSEVIAECATAACAPKVVEAAISEGKVALIMSVGGLMPRPDLFDRARQTGTRIGYQLYVESQIAFLWSCRGASR